MRAPAAVLSHKVKVTDCLSRAVSLTVYFSHLEIQRRQRDEVELTVSWTCRTNSLKIVRLRNNDQKKQDSYKKKNTKPETYTQYFINNFSNVF